MSKQKFKDKIKILLDEYVKKDKSINDLDVISEIAKMRLGRIKSGEIYVNAITKMTFIDKSGNEFKMTPFNVKNGQWSPYESGTVRDKSYHIKILNDIVISKGGKIKDGEVYVSGISKMTFIDKLGNEFKMTPKAVKRGQWSPYESGSVYSDNDYHMEIILNIALSKGGRVKDGQYYTSNTKKMIFIDKLGNEFSMIPSCIKRNQWSPYESKNVRDSNYHMKELQGIVLSKGGKIKDGEKYINSVTKMTFIDQLGNEFKMTPKSVKRGRWSSFEQNCYEHVCRQIIEKIYGKKFPSNWEVLKRRNGNRLQLDGYCEELNIAFEYQGIQHTVGWGKSATLMKKSLQGIQERDWEKKEKCKEKGIFLIEVNYYKKINNYQDMVKQTLLDIKKSYQQNNKDIPLFINYIKKDDIVIDLSKISHLVIMQQEVERLCEVKGGKVKDGERYVGSHIKMICIDKSGNEFSIAPSSLKRGGWSPYERSYRVEYCLNYMMELEKNVKLNGGSIKDGEMYTNSQTKMIFIDKNGVEFKCYPKLIKNGKWPKKHK